MNSSNDFLPLKVYIKLILSWFIKGIFYFLSFFIIIITALYLSGIISIFSNIIPNIFSIFGLIILFYIIVFDTKIIPEKKSNPFLQWFNTFPKRKIGNVYIKCNMDYGIDPKIYPHVEHDEKASLESKVNFLLRQFKDLSKTQNDILQNVDNIKDELHSLKKEIDDKIIDINSSNINLLTNFIYSSYDKHIFAFIINFCALILQSFLK
ncbi:MAG: hypothetical protein ACOYU5_12575 [Stygiobacter sp.]